MLLILISLTIILGALTFFLVRSRASSFFVASRSLPLPIIALTLAAQSIDSNALLGNVDLSFKFHLFDGLVIPLGLSLSLLLNAIFLAGPINRAKLYTLPDIFALRYGRTLEVLMSIATTVSFLFLLAGNLVGMGLILSYLLSISKQQAIWIAAAAIWLYTASGGLLSVAYTDVVQGAIGWMGCLVTAFWAINNASPKAPAPSRGFPGYIYPDTFGEGGVCDLNLGIPCLLDQALCCYNASAGASDNGAYPLGDSSVFSRQMVDPLALTPFPNAILWNWATIFILGFGNLAALDFQARCMAARNPRTAILGCLIAAGLTLLVGIPFSFLGSITRLFYGPDSENAEFKVDSCSTILGLPTCAQWLPDPLAFIRFLTTQAPGFLGGWCLFGLLAASMSTSDGAILAMGTVFAHNGIRQFAPLFPKTLHSGNLLLLARLSTIPFAIIAALIAAYKPDDTANLLVVAFDVVLATTVAPLFGAVYSKRPSASAALLSLAVGAVVRVTLEFALPKDGTFLAPFNGQEFLDFGKAASLKLPTFVEGEEGEVWNPEQEECVQERFRDWSGVDSLVAFAASVGIYLLVQKVEGIIGKRLFRFWGDEGYVKDVEESENKKDQHKDKEEEMVDTEKGKTSLENRGTDEDENEAVEP